eukprot:GFUD01018453.1.p1 GENE.GFUD01018453.1~~GFUD01018453.1.p1  ORF type:complete len:112 (-),score=37.67 GFUD01018453.1:105-440(-)
MSLPQKIASQVRKVSQLSSALGVSHVRSSNPAIQSCPQAYQILHTTGLGQDVEGIGHYKRNSETPEIKDESSVGQMGAEAVFAPLPAKRWEQRVDQRSEVSLSVVGERRSS